MPVTPDELFAFLDRLGITHQTIRHAPLFTVAESQLLRGAIPGTHTKNLFLADKQRRVFLVSAGEMAEIDLKRLHHRLGAGRFSFGSSELMRELLGVEPGAVTPFGLMNDLTRRVTAVVDAPLLLAEQVNFHPLVNTMTTAIRGQDLLKFLAATGHTPMVIEVSGDP